jgi:hypothetical protein
MLKKYVLLVSTVVSRSPPKHRAVLGQSCRIQPAPLGSDRSVIGNCHAEFSGRGPDTYSRALIRDKADVVHFLKANDLA